MSNHPGALNIFLNEPDLYNGVDFKNHPRIGRIYRNGVDIPDPENVHILVVGLKDVIDGEFLARFPNVRHIVSNTTGTDHIRAPEGIGIVHLDPREIEGVTATAEFTLTLMLALVRKIAFIDPERPDDRTGYRGMQLRGRRLGIFGMGRLGKRMARYAEALEMAWTGFDRGDPPEKKRDILETSDIITIHLPLRDETVDFFGPAEFERMERRPYLVNTSRPQIVNKPALIHALRTERIRGAAMDFINYDASFRWDPDLREFMGKNLLATPHIGGNTHESVAFTAQVVVDNLLRKLDLENP